jgi:hypothetical protein
MKTNVLNIQVKHQLAAVLLAVLLSLTFVFQAHAQTADKPLALNETHSFQTAVIATENDVPLYTSGTENTAELNSIYNRYETDNELSIELWMYCDYYWTGKTCEALLNPSDTKDEPLQVEEWMHDDHYWSGK